MKGPASLIVSASFILASFASAQNSIVIFKESVSGDEYHDASWGYYSAPSFLELAHTDKFPVDTEHPYQGSHSVRLHWNSKAGGDWGIAIASSGWPGHDVTAYDSIRYWINAPEAIPQDALPDLLIEDTANKKSTKVWLGDHFGGVDGDAAAWQKVTVPISAFQPGTQKCNFTRIKTLFHVQKNADGVEHTAWLDDIRFVKAGPAPELPSKPLNLSATGYDSRIDLVWDLNPETELSGYAVYRSGSREGPYEKLDDQDPFTCVYCDFTGQNGLTYHYFIIALNDLYEESPPSDTVSASTYQMTDEELLTSVQEAAFRYFYHFGHPASGLAREGSLTGDVCTSGGTGFGLMTLAVGAERGFAPRDSVASRVLKMLRFLQTSCTRYHGAWSHWINGATGAIIPFSENDDGADLVETAYLIQGMLTIRQYFDRSNLVENEIRQRATQMWEAVEWDWFRRTPDGTQLFWHWSPTKGWVMNMPIVGFNETLIVYILAIASQTHGVPASLYDTGWAGHPNYANGNSYYGYKLWVGWPYGGPLFFTHYSFLGFNPAGKRDRFCDYFENNRNIALIHRAYAIDNPKGHAGYDSLTWGLTASFNPWGYSAHEPMNNDNGTIAPTAAICSMPYTPVESLQALKNFYFKYGSRLWGEFGFYDAFNPGQDWFASFYIAIDQGPMVPMIENHRTGLCWRLFMRNPEIRTLLQTFGWTDSAVDGNEAAVPRSLELSQNYPNPFNSKTVIPFRLDAAGPVSLDVLNLMGQCVQSVLRDKALPAGEQRIPLDAGRLPSGIYLYRLKSGNQVQQRKMAVLK
jgi:hypothetical protein